MNYSKDDFEEIVSDIRGETSQSAKVLELIYATDFNVLTEAEKLQKSAAALEQLKGKINVVINKLWGLQGKDHPYEQDGEIAL